MKPRSEPALFKLSARPRAASACARLWLNWARAKGGNVALIFALTLPMLAVLGAGGIEIAQVVNDKKKTQDVADSAAIDGAQQLGVTQAGAAARAQAFAATQLGDMRGYASVTVSATQVNTSTLKVAIDTHRMSFFGNLLPPGGFFTHAEATATAESMVPLCVLGTGTAGTGVLHLTGQAQLQAGQCMIHGDQNLQVDPGAAMSANALEAVGTATGPITPAANTGVKTIDDPFANVGLTAPTTCNAEVVDFSKSVTGTLAAGLHCSAVNVTGGATVTLAPGIHWFKANLQIDDKSAINGTAGAALVFMKGATLQTGAKPKKQNILLRGAKSGPLQGFVLATTRDYGANFVFPSDNIDEITGTIYIPASIFVVNGSSKSATNSPWTVVVAQGMTVNQSAAVVVNSNYAASDVPVPIGVGDKMGSARITR